MRRQPSRILCSRSMPQTAQSVLCSRSMPMPYSVFTVNAADSPACYWVSAVFCVRGQCPSLFCVLRSITSMTQTAQSVLSSRSMPYWVNAIFCVHGQCRRQPSLLLGQCRVNAPDSPVCCVFPVCSRSMPYWVNAVFCAHGQCPRQPSLFCVHGQCPIGSMPYSVLTINNAPDSPVCSVFTVNALLGQCRILSLPQTAQSVLCSRSMPYWVNAVFCPCPRLPSLFCVHPIGSMPYSVLTVNAPDSPVCSIGSMPYAPDSSVCALLGQCRPCPRQPSLFCVHGQCPIAVFCVHGQCLSRVHDQCPRPYGMLKVA